MNSERHTWQVVLLVVGVVAVAAIWGVVLATGPEPDVSQGASSDPLAVEDEQPVSLWVGDSYTAGTGASDQGSAESCLTAERMGWVCNVDAQGGTGFVNDGHENSEGFRPLAGRLAATARDYTADVVVIDAGRNDGAYPAEQVVGAARTYIGRVREAWPDAELVLVAPYFMGNTGDLIPGLTDLYRTEAQKPHTYLIDPSAEGWIGGTAGMTIEDGVHPSPAGHAYIADHLAREFRRLGLDDQAHAISRS